MGKVKEITMEEVANALSVLQAVVEQFAENVQQDGKAEEKEKKSGSKEDYEEMSAVELYKLCQKRGIETEPRKKQAVYIELLKKADEASEEWEDEEKPVKKEEKAGTSKRGRKPSAAKEVKEEEDDDWDL